MTCCINAVTSYPEGSMVPIILPNLLLLAPSPRSMLPDMPHEIHCRGREVQQIPLRRLKCNIRNCTLFLSTILSLVCLSTALAQRETGCQEEPLQCRPVRGACSASSELQCCLLDCSPGSVMLQASPPLLPIRKRFWSHESVILKFVLT